MRPIGWEWGDGSAQRGRSLISTIALLSFAYYQASLTLSVLQVKKPEGVKD